MATPTSLQGLSSLHPKSNSTSGNPLPTSKTITTTAKSKLQNTLSTEKTEPPTLQNRVRSPIDLFRSSYVVFRSRLIELVLDLENVKPFELLTEAEWMSLFEGNFTLNEKALEQTTVAFWKQHEDLSFRLDLYVSTGTSTDVQTLHFLVKGKRLYPMRAIALPEQRFTQCLKKDRLKELEKIRKKSDLVFQTGVLPKLSLNDQHQFTQHRSFGKVEGEHSHKIKSALKSYSICCEILRAYCRETTLDYGNCLSRIALYSIFTSSVDPEIVLELNLKAYAIVHHALKTRTAANRSFHEPNVLADLCGVFSLLGKDQQVLECCARIEKMPKSIVPGVMDGKQHLIRFRFNACLTHYNRGDYSSAQAVFEILHREHWDVLSGEEKFYLLSPHLGRLINSGEIKKAMGYYNTEIRKVYQSLLPLEKQSVRSTVFNNRSILFIAQKEYSEALKEALEFWGLLEQDRKPAVLPWKKREVAFYIITLYEILGKKTEANKFETSNQELLKKKLFQASVFNIYLLNQVAVLMSSRGDYVRGLEFARLAVRLCKGVDRKSQLFTKSLNVLSKLCFRVAQDETNVPRQKVLLKEGLEALKKILAIDEEEITTVGLNQLALYDFTGHRSLIRDIAGFYRLLGRTDKAIELYLKKSAHYFKNFPTLSLVFLKMAYRDAKAIGDQEGCQKALALKRKIFGKQKRYSLAIRSLHKTPINTDVKSRLVIDLEKHRGGIRDDIWGQWERSVENYHELELLYLRSVGGKRPQLFEKAINRTSELLIGLKNILDRSWKIFMTESIHKNKKINYDGELYFPVEGSEAELKEKLKGQQAGSLIKDFPEVWKALLKHQPFTYFKQANNDGSQEYWKNSWLKAMVDIGNDGKHFRLTPQWMKGELQKLTGSLGISGASITIEILERSFFYGSFVKILSQMPGNRTAIPAEAPAETELSGHSGKTSSPPGNIDGNTRKKGSYSTKPASDSPGKNPSAGIAGNRSPLEDIKLSQKIYDQLKINKVIGSNGRYRVVVDEDALSIASLLEKKQSYNKEWKDFKNKIAVLLKGLGHNGSEENEEQIAPLITSYLLRRALRDSYIKVDYRDERAYTDLDLLLTHSLDGVHDIIRALPQPVPKQKVHVQPAVPAEGFSPGEKCEGFVNLWTGFGTLGADFTLEEAILPRGPETLLSKGSSAGTADVQQESSSLSPSLQVQKKLKTLENLALKGGLLLANLKDYCVLHQRATAALQVKRDFKNLGKSYLQAAEVLNQCAPWLAVQYCRKGIQAFKRDVGSSKEALEAAKIAQNIYGRHGLEKKGLRLLQTVLFYRHDVKVKADYDNLITEITKKYSYIDRGILTQLQHAEEMFWKIKYLCFKGINRYGDKDLHARIGTWIADLIVKVHGLLDQSYMNFINRRVYLPAGKPNKDLFFPNTASDELFEAEVVGKYKNIEQLGYIYEKVRRVQRFFGSRPKAEMGWWEALRHLSNKKHDQLSVPSFNLGKIKKHRDIESFYRVQCSPTSFHGGSFNDLFNPQTSSAIFTTLKHLECFDNWGKINVSAKKLAPLIVYVEMIRGKKNVEELEKQKNVVSNSFMKIVKENWQKKIKPLIVNKVIDEIEKGTFFQDNFEGITQKKLLTIKEGSQAFQKYTLQWGNRKIRPEILLMLIEYRELCQKMVGSSVKSQQRDALKESLTSLIRPLKKEVYDEIFEDFSIAVRCVKEDWTFVANKKNSEILAYLGEIGFIQNGKLESSSAAVKELKTYVSELKKGLSRKKLKKERDRLVNKYFIGSLISTYNKNADQIFNRIVRALRCLERDWTFCDPFDQETRSAVSELMEGSLLKNGDIHRGSEALASVEEFVTKSPWGKEKKVLKQQATKAFEKKLEGVEVKIAETALQDMEKGLFFSGFPEFAEEPSKLNFQTMKQKLKKLKEPVLDWGQTKLAHALLLKIIYYARTKDVKAKNGLVTDFKRALQMPTDAQIGSIVDRFAQAIVLKEENTQKTVPILKVLGDALKDTRTLIEAFYKEMETG